MTPARFMILTAMVCFVFLAGVAAVLYGERAALENLSVNTDRLFDSGRDGKSLTVYTRDNQKIYEKITEKTAKLPMEVPADIMFMVKFAGENLFRCERPDTVEERKLLEFHSIPSEGLNSCIVLLAAEKALSRNRDGGSSRLMLWKAASEIVGRYGVDGVLRAYMQDTYMQQDTWGLEAAARSYFGSPLSLLDVSKKSWLAAVLTLGYLPEENPAAFEKRREMLIYRLYTERFIDYEQYADAAGAKISWNEPEEINAHPEYTALILEELREKRIKTDRSLKVYTNLDLTTINAAETAIQTKLKTYPPGVNIALAVVNYETGGVEALAANDRWRWRTMQMRRQIGSTFKPIVYLTAVKEGVLPNEIIVDRQYRYNLGNYVYAPANFEDYYMGRIPMRLGLVHSLNNATILLAKNTGLRKVGQMAVDLGMKARIKPYLAMPLGIFPITPLNLAKVYSVFGTYGLKKEIGFISRIENGNGEEVYLAKKPPERVAPERQTYQVVHMMKDVVYRGTARGSGLVKGTAAKTGTTDEYRDAWTVALFPPYAVVCWVGFDDHRSMGEKGTGGGRAAPVIAEFQKIVTKNTKKIDFNVPEGVVFKQVDRYTGVVPGSACRSRSSYTEAFLAEEAPDACTSRRVAKGGLDDVSMLSD